jgi:S-formylglutathione hydrolase FrmB
MFPSLPWQPGPLFWRVGTSGADVGTDSDEEIMTDRTHLSVLLLALLGSPAPCAETTTAVPLKIAEARKDDDGFLSHAIECEFQKGQTEIKVLLPDRLEKERRYAVVYVLPVEAGTESKFGHGLREVKKLDLHNKHDLIFVLPTFSHLPWYADHPTEPTLRQETYFLKVVVPFVEKQYPAVPEARGRLLLGFSKSGWGAFALLLRHPDTFQRAAAWDAPLNMDTPMFGMGSIVGPGENFDKYRVSRLLEQQAEKLQMEKRLALVGVANFQKHHQATHDLMNRLKIPHEYRDEKKPKHTWDAGWVEDAVNFLATGPKKE